MRLRAPPPMLKRLSMLSLCALGAAISTACVSTRVQTVLSPIPVDPELRAACAAPAQPEDPVTPSDALQFSRAQGAHAACESDRAEKLLDIIDAHNEAAE